MAYKRVEKHLSEERLKFYENPERIANGGPLSDKEALLLQGRINDRDEAAFWSGNLVVKQVSGELSLATRCFLPPDVHMNGTVLETRPPRWLEVSADVVQVIQVPALGQVALESAEAA
jgi:hypothetical protein